MENLFEVNFNQYCNLCKHKETDEEKDPCDMCLAVPCRENTRKPLYFEEKEN